MAAEWGGRAVREGHGPAHIAAIVQAYALIEAAQAEKAGPAIDMAARAASAAGWTDVEILIHFARSLAARQAHLDDSGHLRAMLDMATELGDPALLALAVAVHGVRRADTRQTLELTESAVVPLVQAVGLLDGSAAPVVHRAAALIEVASAAHSLQFWELAQEYYGLAQQALDQDHDPCWASTVARQRRVITYNLLDLVLDWASAQAAIGDWTGAARRAAAIPPGGMTVVDASWPAAWVRQHHALLHLLAAIAGQDPPEPFPPAPSATDGPAWDEVAVAGLAEAIRAARTGDTARAARLADGLPDRLDGDLPAHTWLLCLSIAARQPGLPAATTRYGDELARLRWNARLDQSAAVRDAIAVERRRREHEQLRRQVVVDDLTGLANRRGFHAYLNDLTEADNDLTEAQPGQYAVMMIDVDHFKGVNDTFGHDVGDAVLARIARILARHVRPVDLAARLGGDEFVIVLAEPDPGIPHTRAQTILDAVREHPWHEIAAGLAVSISIGVHQGTTAELPVLLTHADRHLYQAKNQGRGQVAAHSIGN